MRWDRRVATRHRKTWILAAAIAVTGILGIAIAGELVARSQVESRVAALEGSVPGIGITLAAGPVLPHLAAGRIAIDLRAPDAALTAFAACRTGQDLSVHAGAGRVTVVTERRMGGMALPVEVILAPRHDADGWALAAESVNVAGMTLPAERAAAMLAGRGGEGSAFAAGLVEGIRMPGGEQLQVTGVRVDEGALVVTASAAITGSDSDAGHGLSALRECLPDEDD